MTSSTANRAGGTTSIGISQLSWASAAPTMVAAFLAAFVEFVEALTVILAVGAVRGWRPALADVAHAAMFKSGRPLLVVPDDWNAAGLTRNIALAWQSGDHCRRAVAGALPWLRRAGVVSVIIIADSGDGASDDEIKQQLDHAGVESIDTKSVAASGDLGAQLLKLSGDLGAKPW